MRRGFTCFEQTGALPAGKRAALIGAILAGVLAGAARGQDKLVPGELFVERPTLICLGFDWGFSGDANGNASLKAEYRKAGETAWRGQLPMYRSGGDGCNYGNSKYPDPKLKGQPALVWQAPTSFMGSLLDLEPGTEYEVRLEWSDPDGVEGEAVKTLKLRTRPEPRPFEGGEVRHVYPKGFKGPKEEPAYGNVMHAVNGFATWCDNYQTVHPAKAPPGTVVKVHAGVYKDDFTSYRDADAFLHGTITLVADGEPGKPIAIVAAGDGEVVFDGNGADNLFNVMAADYLHFEGLTIRNTRIAFHGGFQGVLGCKGLAVKRCRIENVQYGVLAQDGRSEDFSILDNVFVGANPADRFNPESGGAYGRTKAGYAVNLSGQGHAVGHNRAANFWDILDVFTNALADPALKQQARAIDFYNNDLFNGTDNFIEADGGYGNIRVLRNRCFNCMGAPLSIQRVYVGPSYWIGNIVFNAQVGIEAFKPDGSGSNVIVLHNTFANFPSGMGRFRRLDMRNNLFMGPAGKLGGKEDAAPILAVGKPAALDHNGYRVGREVREPFRAEGAGGFETLAAFAAATGFETHGIELRDYGIFEGAAEPEEYAKSNTSPLIDPATVDLRLKAGAPPVDAGVAIPGVNDGFEGKAPDMGALERGRPVPVFGPRPE